MSAAVWLSLAHDALGAYLEKEKPLPTVIMGDFNAEPRNIPTCRMLIEDLDWCDIGENASWWQGIDAQKTCRTGALAKETRIDAMLVSPMALRFVKHFEVVKDPDIPTELCSEGDFQR